VCFRGWCRIRVILATEVHGLCPMLRGGRNRSWAIVMLVVAALVALAVLMYR